MHNFKKLLFPVIFLAIIFCINEILVLALKPVTNFRNDMHYLETGEYTDIFIGTSHGKAGINPKIYDQVTGTKSVNMCLGGETVVDSLYIIKEACRVGNPKRVVYELDPGYWVESPTLGPEYRTIYDEFPMSKVKAEYYFDKIWDTDFRTTLFPWYLYRTGFKGAIPRMKSKFSTEYLNYKDAFYDTNEQVYGNQGQYAFRRGELPKTEFNLVLWNEEKVQKKVMEAFDELVKLCEEQGIELIVIIAPVPKETLEKYAKEYTAAYTFFSKYMEGRNIPFYNFNDVELEQFDRTVTGYFDYDGHMFEDQAVIFTKKLGNIINSM